jgi:hypothetical protein
LPASSVKTRRIGLSTSVEPISKDQYIPNDDKTKKIAQFVKKPHEDASKKFNLKAPPPSYTGDNWKYFHVVGYYKDSPKEQHNHSTDNEYACCNICGATVMFKKKAKTGAGMRSTGAGMKAHLESVHKLYKEPGNASKSNNATIIDEFEKQYVPK